MCVDLEWIEAWDAKVRAYPKGTKDPDGDVLGRTNLITLTTSDGDGGAFIGSKQELIDLFTTALNTVINDIPDERVEE